MEIVVCIYYIIQTAICKGGKVQLCLVFVFLGIELVKIGGVFEAIMLSGRGGKSDVGLYAHLDEKNRVVTDINIIVRCRAATASAGFPP
jgi:hypothetical protein